MFTDIWGKSICLVCVADVAVTKEYNLRRHYEGPLAVHTRVGWALQGPAN